MESRYSIPEIGLQLHDPLTIWYLLSRDRPELGLKVGAEEDIRVETAGQWTRGMCVVDRRNLKRDGMVVEGEWEELPGDHGNWLNGRGGNRVRRAVESPVVERFERELLRRIFGVELNE
jgi:inosine-uridine nucleoside N-ribohydrolase